MPKALAIESFRDQEGARKGVLCVHTDGSISVVTVDDRYTGCITVDQGRLILAALLEAFEER